LFYYVILLSSQISQQLKSEIMMSSDAIMEPSSEIKQEDSNDSFSTSMFFEEGSHDDIEKDAATIKTKNSLQIVTGVVESISSGEIRIKQESPTASKTTSMFFHEESKLKTELPKTPESKKVQRSFF
jgi:hypothetical protein